jgi:hypothetical protein
MTMYLGTVPAGQQRPQAFVATPGLYASPGLLSGPQQQQQPLYQQAAWAQDGTPARRRLGPAVAGQLLQHHGIPPALYLGPGLGGELRHDTPHHSASW